MADRSPSQLSRRSGYSGASSVLSRPRTSAALGSRRTPRSPQRLEITLEIIESRRSHHAYHSQRCPCSCSDCHCSSASMDKQENRHCRTSQRGQIVLVGGPEINKSTSTNGDIEDHLALPVLLANARPGSGSVEPGRVELLEDFLASEHATDDPNTAVKSGSMSRAEPEQEGSRLLPTQHNAHQDDDKESRDASIYTGSCKSKHCSVAKQPSDHVPSVKDDRALDIDSRSVHEPVVEDIPNDHGFKATVEIPVVVEATTGQPVSEHDAVNGVDKSTPGIDTTIVEQPLPASPSMAGVPLEDHADELKSKNEKALPEHVSEKRCTKASILESLNSSDPTTVVVFASPADNVAATTNQISQFPPRPGRRSNAPPLSPASSARSRRPESLVRDRSPSYVANQEELIAQRKKDAPRAYAVEDLVIGGAINAKRLEEGRQWVDPKFCPTHGDACFRNIQRVTLSSADFPVVPALDGGASEAAQSTIRASSVAGEGLRSPSAASHVVAPEQSPTNQVESASKRNGRPYIEDAAGSAEPIPGEVPVILGSPKLSAGSRPKSVASQSESAEHPVEQKAESLENVSQEAGPVQQNHAPDLEDHNSVHEETAAQERPSTPRASSQARSNASKTESAKPQTVEDDTRSISNASERRRQELENAHSVPKDAAAPESPAEEAPSSAVATQIAPMEVPKESTPHGAAEEYYHPHDPSQSSTQTLANTSARPEKADSLTGNGRASHTSESAAIVIDQEHDQDHEASPHETNGIASPSLVAADQPVPEHPVAAPDPVATPRDQTASPSPLTIRTGEPEEQPHAAAEVEDVQAGSYVPSLQTDREDDLYESSVRGRAPTIALRPLSTTSRPPTSPRGQSVQSEQAQDQGVNVPPVQVSQPSSTTASVQEPAEPGPVGDESQHVPPEAEHVSQNHATVGDLGEPGEGEPAVVANNPGGETAYQQSRRRRRCHCHDCHQSRRRGSGSQSPCVGNVNITVNYKPTFYGQVYREQRVEGSSNPSQHIEESRSSRSPLPRTPERHPTRLDDQGSRSRHRTSSRTYEYSSRRYREENGGLRNRILWRCLDRCGFEPL